MWFRPLALIALTAGLIVLVGDFATADAGQLQKKLKQKKAKKGKQGEPEVPLVIPDPIPPKPPLPVLPTVVPPPSSKDAAALAKFIDAEISARLSAANIAASPVCSDDEFLRRASLDIAGVIPSADKAREFLDNHDPDKRAQLLDQLLADTNYGRRMADIWTAKLFPVDSANRFVLREPLYKWFEEEFNKNVHWDKLVASIVTASGAVEDNPAATYFLANRSIDKLTDTTAQYFMGVQLQCAQCHNHPFTTWKQTEYWGMAAFYSKVRADNPKNPKKGGDAAKTGVTEINGRSRQKDFFPESAKNVPAKYLGGVQPKLPSSEPYRPALASWLTAPDNPYFSRAIVNRTWAHLFGRGIVNPVDDMLDENKPTHPELLDALSRHLASSGEFDLKYLIKAICLSETYQRTSKPIDGNREDAKLFSHMTMKVMSPEQLFDSLAQVTGNIAARGGPKGAKAAIGPKGRPAGARTQFVNFFLAGASATSPVEYEAGIPQALRLMNSPIANNPAAARNVVGSSPTPTEAIERIYLATLSRRPTADEMKMLLEYVAKADNPRMAYSDLLWATLNSSEFTLVR